MTEAQAYEAIVQRWAAAWTAAQPAVPYVLGNEAAPGGVAFVALTFGELATRRITQGPTARKQYRGIVHVRVFGAVDAGDAPTLSLSASVRAALEDRTIATASGDVFMWTAPAAQSSKQGNWYTRLVSIQFTFYGAG